MLLLHDRESSHSVESGTVLRPAPTCSTSGHGPWRWPKTWCWRVPARGRAWCCLRPDWRSSVLIAADYIMGDHLASVTPLRKPPTGVLILLTGRWSQEINSELWLPRFAVTALVLSLGSIRP